MSRWEYKVI